MNRKLNKLLNSIMDGYRLRLRDLGLSQRKFCEIADIHENTFYNMKNPRISTLQKIDEALTKLESKQ